MISTRWHASHVSLVLSDWRQVRAGAPCHPADEPHKRYYKDSVNRNLSIYFWPLLVTHWLTLYMAIRVQQRRIVYRPTSSSYQKCQNEILKLIVRPIRYCVKFLLMRILHWSASFVRKVSIEFLQVLRIKLAVRFCIHMMWSKKTVTFSGSIITTQYVML